MVPCTEPGIIESVPHDLVHRWTGDNKTPNGEDMANFYSSARDPIFYCLHYSNVDYLWTIWKILGGKRKDINKQDYLDTTFLLYDEKSRLVRCKIRDCLDTRNFYYVYQDVEILWLKPPPRRNQVVFPRSKTARKVGPGPVHFSIRLKSVAKVEVKRPRKSRSKRHKDDEEEVLMIDGIQFNTNYPMKFDVFINNEDDEDLSAGKVEFAASFVNVAHRSSNKKNQASCFRIGINRLLEDLGAEGDDNLVVTLVSRLGNPTIGGVKLEYVKSPFLGVKL